MSRNIEPIFELDDVLEFNYNRQREDYVKVAPNGTPDYTQSVNIVYEINNQQYFINLAESFLVVNFKITKADGTALGADEITLENNFFPRMFKNMDLTVGGRQIETIAVNPGEASTLANFVMAPEAYNRSSGQISGWFPDTNKGDTAPTAALTIANLVDVNYNYLERKKVYNTAKEFTINFPLKYLFGFTEYKKILYLIKIGLKLNMDTPASYSPDIFFGGAGTNGKLLIQNSSWWIPYIDPSDEVRDIVNKGLQSSTPISCIFMERNMNYQSIPAGSTYVWSLGNYSNSVRFIIVGFKSITPAVATANNALFTEHADGATATKITSLRVQLNNMYIPNDRMEMDFETYKLNEPYQAYIDMCARFGNDPQISVQDFHDNYPIFCFDVSAQPEQLKSNGIDIRLHINKISALALNGYALVLSDAEFTINTGDGRMLSISSGKNK